MKSLMPLIADASVWYPTHGSIHFLQQLPKVTEYFTNYIITITSYHLPQHTHEEFCGKYVHNLYFKCLHVWLDTPNSKHFPHLNHISSHGKPTVTETPSLCL